MRWAPLFECQRRGLRIPQDFGICGFNDLEMMAAANPAITSVRTHRLDMGRDAFRMLNAALSGVPPTEKVIDIGYDVIARQSTARSP